jgi:hypothetical protein
MTQPQTSWPENRRFLEQMQHYLEILLEQEQDFHPPAALVPAVASHQTKIPDATSTDLLDGGSTGLLFSNSSDNNQNSVPQAAFFSNPAPAELQEEIIPTPKSQALL